MEKKNKTAAWRRGTMDTTSLGGSFSVESLPSDTASNTAPPDTDSTVSAYNPANDLGECILASDIPTDVSLPTAIYETLEAVVDNPVLDGRVHRFAVNGNNKNGWYWGDVLEDGTQYAVYNCWTRVCEDNFHWSSKGVLTDEELAIIKAKNEAKMAQLEAESDTIVQGLQNTLSAANVAPDDHWYFQSKGVKNYGELVKLDARGNLVIPAYRGSELHTVQIIYPVYKGHSEDGTPGNKKIFMKGIRSAGCWFRFVGNDRVILCEGYATGYSIWRATGATVISCFSANNIAKVATNFPNASMVVADNDENHAGENGAKATGLKVVLIPFVGMDANDYEQKYGTEALRNLILGDVSKKIIRLTADFFRQEAPEDFIIDGIIPDKSIGLIFGKSGSRKSFVSIDMGLSIASGMNNWFGHEIGKDKKILYLCAEGYLGVKHRIIAWCKYHGVDKSRLLDSFFLIDHAIKLDNGGNLTELKQDIKDMNIDPDLIFVDTGRRCMSGEENSSDDTENFLSSCDELKNEFECSLIVIHHTAKGKDEESPRGSGVWIDHMDFAHCISKDDKGITKFKAFKMKDGNTDLEKYFQLEDVSIGWFKTNGEEISSAVIRNVETYKSDTYIQEFVDAFEYAITNMGDDFELSHVYDESTGYFYLNSITLKQWIKEYSPRYEKARKEDKKRLTGYVNKDFEKKADGGFIKTLVDSKDISLEIVNNGVQNYKIYAKSDAIQDKILKVISKVTGDDIPADEYLNGGSNDKSLI